MTQALAVQSMLLDAGHQVCGILVGRQPTQPPPEFFVRKAAAPITYYQTFAFATDPQNKAISPSATLLRNLKDARALIRSIFDIRDEIHRHKPDVVLNFFEPLVGICYALSRPQPPLVCLANQYLLLHPDYPFPPGRWIERLATQFWAGVTSVGAKRKLALSLKPRANVPAGTVVIPPLLRPEILARTDDSNGRFLLIYLLKAGLRDEIIAWHKSHPDFEIHCFTDLAASEGDEVRFDDTLTFHRVHETKFLDLMVKSGGMVATAGYQTLSEALYFGKPLLTVPVANHFEQACNAHEAPLVGAGIAATTFDLDRFLAYLPTHRTDRSAFRRWVAQAPQRIVSTLEEVAGRTN
jgi:uncharacterized protein (TIGR00661 family)